MAKSYPLMDLLKLLEACGGEVETRIKLQKQVYLLSMAFPGFFNSVDFEYHHYGPYSRSLSDILQLSVISGFVEEVDETPSDHSFTKYRYVLTDRGRAAALEYGSDLKGFNEVASKLNSQSWRTLELVATVKYLETREKLDFDAAFARALTLKPATSGFENPARRLLDELA